MKRICFIVAAAALAVSAPPASAQTLSPSATALTACVQQSSTSDDNLVLMKWLFIAIARHPGVAQMATITDAQRVQTNSQMGAMLNRILLDSCADQTRAAFQADGVDALRAPFSAFGNQAMTQLMTNPDVNAGIAEMASYIDQQRLIELAAPISSPPPSP